MRLGRSYIPWKDRRSPVAPIAPVPPVGSIVTGAPVAVWLRIASPPAWKDRTPPTQFVPPEVPVGRVVRAPVAVWQRIAQPFPWADRTPPIVGAPAQPPFLRPHRGAQPHILRPHRAEVPQWRRHGQVVAGLVLTDVVWPIVAVLQASPPRTRIPGQTLPQVETITLRGADNMPTLQRADDNITLTGN